MLFVKCKNWWKFCSVVKDSKFVIYECRVGNIFRISAMWDEYSMVYEEAIPEEKINDPDGVVIDYVITEEKTDNYTIAGKPIRKKLNCGLIYRIIPKLRQVDDGWINITEIDMKDSAVKRFLVKNLGLDESKIIKGSISQVI